jgi:RimJ/RimL family protein N-acetyltransferase
MITSGLTRSVTAVPGAIKCEPSGPQTGWWWGGPSESGRGYGIEVKGLNLFYAAFLYDTDGRATWTIASGPTSIDGSVFAADLLQFGGGQTLAGAYKAPGPAQTVGSMLLTFNTEKEGTMVWPGGVVPIQRFDFKGVDAPPQVGVPESGWWWNPAESGRGYFIEWQNGTMDMAGFMYDDAGNPIWYLVVADTPDPAVLSSSWTRYANGQTLTGAYKPATLVNANEAPVTIQFDSTTTGTMTLPGNKSIRIERQPF